MSIDWGAELDRVAHATQPMAEGAHNFRIVEAKPTKASTGNQMIKLTCKAEGGPDDGKTGYVNIVFSWDSPRAMKMTLRRLRALGIGEELLRTEKPSYEQIAGKLIGRLVEGTVAHRQWNGETQDDIDFTGGGSGIPSVPQAPGVPNVPAAAPAAAPSAEVPPTPVIPTPDTAGVETSTEQNF